MKKASPDSNLVPYFLIVFGFLILVAVWITKVTLMRDGARAKGVIEKVTCCSRKSVGIALRIDEGIPAPPLRFGTSADRSDNYQVGEVVTVVFDRYSPSGAMIFRGEPTWTPVYLSLAAGGFVLLGGIALLGFLAWIRREELRRKEAERHWSRLEEG